VVVARPDLSGLAEPGTFPHHGEELRLLWPRPSGQMQLRVSAVAGSRPYGPVWVLTPIGAPTREQRRQFFRVPLTLPAVLTPVVDGSRTEEGAVRATLVEVSEGGALICCAAGLPEVGTLVELSFTLHDTTVTVDAEVLRHDGLATARPSAALRFLDPAAYGDHIRRFAFAVQRTRARTPLS
jgi:c-di-GMP-binding flagellar brake protein YcgR